MYLKTVKKFILQRKSDLFANIKEKDILCNGTQPADYTYLLNVTNRL